MFSEWEPIAEAAQKTAVFHKQWILTRTRSLMFCPKTNLLLDASALFVEFSILEGKKTFLYVSKMHLYSTDKIPLKLSRVNSNYYTFSGQFSETAGEELKQRPAVSQLKQRQQGWVMPFIRWAAILQLPQEVSPSNLSCYISLRTSNLPHVTFLPAERTIERFLFSKKITNCFLRVVWLPSRLCHLKEV